MLAWQWQGIILIRIFIIIIAGHNGSTWLTLNSWNSYSRYCSLYPDHQAVLHVGHHPLHTRPALQLHQLRTGTITVLPTRRTRKAQRTRQHHARRSQGFNIGHAITKRRPNQKGPREGRALQPFRSHGAGKQQEESQGNGYNWDGGQREQQEEQSVTTLAKAHKLPVSIANRLPQEVGGRNKIGEWSQTRQVGSHQFKIRNAEIAEQQNDHLRNREDSIEVPEGNILQNKWYEHVRAAHGVRNQEGHAGRGEQHQEGSDGVSEDDGAEGGQGQMRQDGEESEEARWLADKHRA